MEFRTQYNYKQCGAETITGECMTIQNDAPDLKDLLNHYAQGLPLPLNKRGIFDEEDTTIEDEVYNPQDLTDVDELERQLQHIRQELKKDEEEWKRKQQEREKKIDESALNKKVELMVEREKDNKILAGTNRKTDRSEK